MEIIVATAAQHRLYASTMKVGDSVLRINKGKKAPGVVISVGSIIEIRFRDLGIEKYSHASFDGLVAKGYMREATKGEAEGIKGAMRKDKFRATQKAGPKPGAVRANVNARNKVEQDLDEAYSREPNKREAAIRTVIEEARKAGVFTNYVSGHPLTGPLREAFPLAKFDAYLDPEIPSLSEYQSGMSPLRAIGLQVRIPGLSYYLRTSKPGNKALWKIELGTKSFTSSDPEEVVQKVQSFMPSLARRSDKNRERSLVSAGENRNTETRGMHQHLTESMKRIGSRIDKVQHAEKAAKKLRLGQVDPSLPRIIERCLEAYLSAEKASEKVKNHTDLKEGDDVTSARIIKLRAAFQKAEQKLSVADGLFSDIEFSFRNHGVPMGPLPKLARKK